MANNSANLICQAAPDVDLLLLLPGVGGQGRAACASSAHLSGRDGCVLARCSCAEGEADRKACGITNGHGEYSLRRGGRLASRRGKGVAARAQRAICFHQMLKQALATSISHPLEGGMGGAGKASLQNRRKTHCRARLKLIMRSACYMPHHLIDEK